MRYQRIPPETAAQFIACKNRREWHVERGKSLGTSEIGTILGVSLFDTLFSLYARKRIDPATGKPLIPSSEPTEAMTWGLLLEDVVRRHYAQETGRKIWHREHTLFRHPELPFHCSLDGIAIDKEGKRVLEIKTAWGMRTLQSLDNGIISHQKDWGDEGTDDIPLSYNAGVQWSMGILGPDWKLADVAVLFGGNKYRCYTVERDDAIIKQMQEAALTFWQRMENGQPPEVNDGSTQTRKALEALYAPMEQGEIIEAGFKEKAIMGELETAKAVFKEAEADKKRLENIICAAIGPELGLTDGERTCTWKSQERKGYTVQPTTCRVLRLSKVKEKKT